MHTTLEAFLREAIEDILRRKRSDMMKKKEERSTIYPSLIYGVVKAIAGYWSVTEVDGEKWGFSGD
jgi:hypothetical protein